MSENLIPLLVALFGAFVVIRMLISGGASADGQGFRREDQPFIYWCIVTVALGVDLFLFYLALR